MSILNLLLGASMLVIGVGLAIRAGRGTTVVARLLRRPTLPLARLRHGPVEVSGTVMAEGEPLLSLSGQRCVAVKTTVRGRSASGTSSGSQAPNTVQLVVPTRLVDATGDCRLDLDLAEIVGERWESKELDEAELGRVAGGALVSGGSAEITIEEEIIPEGRTVIVSGDASDEARFLRNERDGKAEQWVLSGTEDHLLVIALGGQTRLVAKSVALATLVFVVAAYLTAVGALTVALTLSM